MEYFCSVLLGFIIALIEVAIIYAAPPQLEKPLDHS
jgi:hypothetical protein